MPTERFYRLPQEKAEVIRKAAAREFMRVPPEEASINRIIRDAEISRGSFYTYFTDKDDLLRWLIGGSVKRHLRFYVNRMQENGGDIWDVFDQVLDATIDQTVADGLIEIIENLMKSNTLSELFQKGMEEDSKAGNQARRHADWLYQHLNPEKCPMDRDTFQDLMEIHRTVLMMALKRFFKEGRRRELVTEYYKRYMRILRYGISGYRGVMQEEKKQEENR